MQVVFRFHYCSQNVIGSLGLDLDSDSTRLDLNPTRLDLNPTNHPKCSGHFCGVAFSYQSPHVSFFGEVSPVTQW